MILTTTSQLSEIPKKIVSLVPSQTELLNDLGVGSQVVGITKFCVHPEGWLKNKTIIGGTKNLNLKKIRQLHPDLIIANKEENVKEQVEELAEEFNVWLTDVNNLRDAIKMTADISVLTNTSAKAVNIIEAIETSFATLSQFTNQYKTCYLIWRNPYMSVGGDTFISDMLCRCGFQNIFANKKRYPVIEIEMLEKAGCEVLLLSSEPFPFLQQHVEELQLILPKIKIIKADGEMFSWYGSRLQRSPEYFKQLLIEVAK